MKKTFFLLIAIIVPMVFYAQDVQKSYKIKGIVADSISQKTIPYVTVSVFKQPEHKLVKKLAAGPSGQFDFEVKATGLYELNMQMVGYKIGRKNFEVKESSKALDLGQIGISEQTQAINEVQVLADKPLVKVDAEKITYNTDQDPDSKTSNVMDMLRKVPLLTVDGEDNVQLKGSTSFKIFINGKPSTMMTNNPKDVLKSMPANMIKNIEVITSPGAKYDAEGIGGIINIVTQKNSMKGFTTNLNLGANTLRGKNANVYLAGTFGKLTFSTNLSLNDWRSPSLANSSFKEDFVNAGTRYTNTSGISKYHGLSGFGNGELSYEIDTLNLITGSFNFWGGKFNNENNSGNEILNSEGTAVQLFELANSNDSYNTGPQGNLDYQHTFKRNKEQTFTLSYNISYNPSTSNGNNTVNNLLNYPYPSQKNDNDAYSSEQTFQADYVHPFTSDFKLELGGKYIYRRSESESDYNSKASSSDEYVWYRTSNFNYTQKIYSGYTSLNYKYKQANARIGLRMEGTTTDGEVIETVSTTFENNNFNLVPNANLSYQIKPNQTARLSYNLRLQRPGIWYLNPYVNKIDPLNVSYGNPNLETERFHNVDLNYSIFGKLGNINVSTSYMYSDNSIDRTSEVKDGVTTSTYHNVAISNVWNNSLYGSLRFQEKLTISLNASLAYRELSSSLAGSASASGWNHNASTNIQYVIVKGLRVSAYGGLFKTPKRLQSSSVLYYYSGASLSKEFFKGMMTVSVSCQNIFWNTMSFTNESRTDYYYNKSTFERPGRSYNFNLSFRLGSMNAQVKKAQRGIKNDDVKSGESNNAQ